MPGTRTSSTLPGSWWLSRHFIIHGFHPRLLIGLTPAGVRYQTNDGIQIKDHEVVEPLNSPRCNLGININKEEDDNPEGC